MARPRFTPSPSYEAPGGGDYIEDDPFAVRDLFVTNAVSEVIERHYPGHPWMVKVSHHQGIVQISIPPLMGGTNWMVIPLGDLKADSNMKLVRDACGEILERFNIPRCAYRPAHFNDALQAVPLHLRGFRGHVPG